MLRAYLTDDRRCYNHPHRIVKTVCARCKTPFCDECLTTRTDGVFARIVERDEKNPAPLFCERCIEEIGVLNAAEAARKRPLWQRLRPTPQQLRRVAAYVAVIAVIMVPIAFAVRNMSATTLSPEELARIKVGLQGSFQTPDGTNFVSQVYGGRFVRASAPSRPEHDPHRLIDTWVTQEVPGWESESATFPQEIVFALPNKKTLVNRVILRPHPSEPAETWVKDFEVLVSTDTADSGFRKVLSGTLGVEQAKLGLNPENAEQPRFEFPSTDAKYVMLRVLSNNGSTDYTSLGEFEIYWLKK